MKKEIKKLPDAELEIMMAIWQAKPPVTRGDLDEFLDDSKKRTDTTVLTLLSRLGVKGFLSVEKQGNKNMYLPIISKKEYMEIENESFLTKIHKSSITSMMASMAQTNHITQEDIAEIEQFIKQLKGE